MLCLFAGLMVAWLCQTYPSRLPVWAPTEFSWPTFLCCSGGLWCYGQGLIRTPSKARASILRQVCFGVGVLSVYAVLQTHFLYLAQHVFFLNRLQHLVMHHIGPFLIAASWPGATLGKGAPQHVLRLTRNRWLSGAIRAVQHPVLASFLFAGLILLWLVPSIHFRAMISPRLYAIMNWSMVLDGLLFWFLVLDPRPQPIVPLSYAVRLLLVFGVQLPQIIAGGVILHERRPLRLLRPLRTLVPGDRGSARPGDRRLDRLLRRRHDECCRGLLYSREDVAGRATAAC